MVPPHLPPPASDLATHKRWVRVKLIILISALSVFAGVTGGIMVIGWVWPNFIQEYGGGVSYTHQLPEAAQLSDRTRQELNERIMTVYQSTIPTGSASYSAVKGRHSEAVVVSSDGWILFYDQTPDKNIKNWRVIGFDGAVYTISELVPDVRSGLTYAKLNVDKLRLDRQQFKVANFSLDLKPLDELFVYDQGGWQPSVAQFPVARVLGDAYLDSTPNDFYALEEEFTPGSIVANVQGEITGIVREKNIVALSRSVVRALPNVLGQQRAIYASLGVEGVFSSDQPVLKGNSVQSGFLVTKVVSPGQIRRGDIIVEINGQVVTSATLWHTISSKPATVRLTVVRANKNIELTVPVVEL